MPAGTTARFEIEVVRSWDAIASRWDRLSRLGAATPFQARPWIENWYAVLGRGPGIDSLFVVVKRASDGRDLMIIPLIRRTSQGIRHIEFADLWVTDYNAPLVHPEFDGDAVFEREIWPQILAQLAPADFINFTKMPLTIGGRANPIARLSAAKQSTVNGHIVPLPRSWDDYLATLSKDTRRTLKKKWAKFAERGATELRRVTTEPEALVVLDALHAQQTARLSERGADHIFNNPLYDQLYRRYVVKGLADGSVALYALYDSGAVVATFLGLVNGAHCTLIRSSQSNDEGLRSFSLGRLIMIRALEDLHGEGCQLFDLSIGSHAYKDEFRVSQLPLADFNQRLSWRALPLVAKHSARAMLTRYPRLHSWAKTLSTSVSQRNAA